MKRNKDKRIFAKILIRYIICTVVFSIPLWVFADRYVLLIEAVTGSGSFYDIGTVIVTNLVLAFVITLIFMLRAAARIQSNLLCKFIKTGSVYLGFYTLRGKKFPYGNFRTTLERPTVRSSCQPNRGLATAS